TMAGSISAPLVLPLIPPTQKHKNHIQTCTRVCLQTESPDAEIFFTLDGSKPNSRSRKYTAPITLPPGRVCVRAQAQSSDFRESLIVTKFFTVDDVTYDTTSDPANDSPALITLTNQSEAHLTPVPPSHLRSLLANSRPATPTSGKERGDKEGGHKERGDKEEGHEVTGDKERKRGGKRQRRRGCV
uniref:GH29D-like beta-sandwich domain-containing protein n=1 Tax=Periophthalmus magnuspinnatus TaxID=409849 RepID=A0A3B4B113_9GOBI